MHMVSAVGSRSDEPAVNRPIPRRTELSPDRLALLEEMQSMNFGRIEGLVVRGGEPVLDPRPRIVREVKFGGDNGPRPELGAGDFALKAQVVELFAYFDRLKDGAVEVIEIKHGLPFRMLIAEAAA